MSKHDKRAPFVTVQGSLDGGRHYGPSRGTGLTAAARGEFVREVEAASAPAAPPPSGAVWNNIRRLWMVDGVAVDPQPAAPVGMAEIRAGGRTIGFLEFAPSDVTVERVPPAVKVTA